MHVSVVRAEAANADQLANDVAQLRGDVGNTELTSLLSDSSIFLYVGYVDGEPAGVLTGYDLQRLDGRTMRLIYDVETVATKRRRGVARRVQVEGALPFGPSKRYL